jgi:Tfp pilus assembly PilM family ATPase
MSRLIAIEWDNREARVAVATEKRGQASIEDVFAIPFEPTTGPKEIGRQLAAGLATRRVRGGKALVGVGRTSIELKMFNLPPAPDEDLPEMVRFQAPREFASWGEGWPLDFVAIAGEADQQRTVLAATIPPDAVKHIEEICATAGLKPEHLILRPCAAASLLARSKKQTSAEPQLLVDLLADELDLTVTIADRVVFTRTARLPSDALATADFAKPLVAEVRRTLGAVQNQLGGRRVERVWLYAGGDEHVELARHLAESLNLPTEVFDPFAGVANAERLGIAKAPHRGRFAPVLGMLLDAASETPHAIDFLSPKRRPEKPSQRPRVLVYATAATLLIAMGIGWYSWYLSSLDKQIADWNQQNSAKQKLVDQYTQVVDRVTSIDAWRAGDVPWLEEMKRLAEKLPPPEDVMLTEVRFAAQQGGGGKIEFDGLVKSLDTVQKVENGLRDAGHQVQSLGTSRDTETKPYEWDFGTEIILPAVEAP